MSFLEFLSPIARKRNWFLGFWAGFILLFLAIFLLLPPVSKSTVYFSIRPVGGGETTVLDPGVEDAEKIAEMIAGWARDPGFREEILQRSETVIPGFKRKLSARKQNRLNVFWTLSLSGRETRHAEKLSETIVTLLQETFGEFSQNSRFAFELTEPNVYHDTDRFPISWVIAAILILSAFLGGASVYLVETFQGKLSFLPHVWRVFPESPLLRVPGKLRAPEEKLIEQFVLQFPNPRLIGTFETAEKYFALSPIEAVDFEGETPILLVKLGETTSRNLENLQAILGDGVGIIVFES